VYALEGVQSAKEGSVWGGGNRGGVCVGGVELGFVGGVWMERGHGVGTVGCVGKWDMSTENEGAMRGEI
jgi:hypothetical protein